MFVLFFVADEARITEHPTDMSVTYGTPLEFICVGTGIPVPAIKWFKNGEPVSKRRRRRRCLRSLGCMQDAKAFYPLFALRHTDRQVKQ
jgi:hypothetical protein